MSKLSYLINSSRKSRRTLSLTLPSSYSLSSLVSGCQSCLCHPIYSESRRIHSSSNANLSSFDVSCIRSHERVLSRNSNSCINRDCMKGDRISISSLDSPDVSRHSHIRRYGLPLLPHHGSRNVRDDDALVPSNLLMGYYVFSASSYSLVNQVRRYCNSSHREGKQSCRHQIKFLHQLKARGIIKEVFPEK